MKRKPPKVNAAYPARVRAAAKAEVAANRSRPRAVKRAKGPKVKAQHVAAFNATDMRRLSDLTDGELKERGLARYGGVVLKARPFQAPALPPGVVPTNVRALRPLLGESRHMALDSAMVAPMYTWANQQCGLIGFPGYPYLAELALRSEYRAASETTAKEMTRRWVILKSAAAGDKDEKIKEITDTLDKFKVRALWRKAIELDGYFGRSQIYLGIKGQDSDLARQKPLKYKEETLGVDCLESLSVIEPMWTTPYSYNSIDPTAPDFFRPVSWFILGKKTHASRLLPFISRPVPDLFKPAYNFSGLSMSQLMEPYTLQWFRARDSVSDMLYNYSTSGVATNLASVLEDDGADGLQNRAMLFNQVRGSRGLMLIDKDTEEFFQFNTPLAGLADLMAHFQEQMASPSKMPLVKLIGRSPGGLNSSSEEEITVYYDHLHSEQEGAPDDNIDVLLDVVQLHLYGTIDEDITHEWVPLEEPSQKELSEIRTADATAGANYITNGVISSEEERQRLQNDPNSGYSGLEGPPPELNPDQITLAMQQEHDGAQNDADRDHATSEADRERKHGAKESDKDRRHDSGEADRERKHGSKEAGKERTHGAGQADKDRQIARQKTKSSSRKN